MSTQQANIIGINQIEAHHGDDTNHHRYGQSIQTQSYRINQKILFYFRHVSALPSSKEIIKIRTNPYDAVPSAC